MHSPDEIEVLERLFRVRRGNASDEDWKALESRHIDVQRTMHSSEEIELLERLLRVRRGNASDED